MVGKKKKKKKRGGDMLNKDTNWYRTFKKCKTYKRFKNNGPNKTCT